MTDKKLKILFISRAYPPVTGGIENHNFELSQQLQTLADTKILANRYGKKFLPAFLPFAAVYAILSMLQRDALILGDGVLGPVGWLVKAFYGNKRKVICVVHGLDLTYSWPVYQKLWVRYFIPAADQLVAVSNETIKAGLTRGISETKFTFIPNGVDTDKFSPENIPRKSLEDLLSINLDNKHILYTGGRLIKRKGVEWFIQNVMPILPDNIIYIISGNGPELNNIQNAASTSGMRNRVIILGYASAEELRILFNTCDIFIQPNIPIDGDIEGFGLVVLEAVSSGLPVVAAKIDGLVDAIIDGKNGHLAEPKEPESYKSLILPLLEDETSTAQFAVNAREYTEENFQWPSITRQYIKILEK